MVDSIKRSMIDYFDSVAARWESLLSVSTERAVRAIMTTWRSYIGSTVLDVGAGTGFLLRFLEPTHTGTYIGLEVSPGMIEEFRKHHPHYRIVHGDIEESSTLEGESFDTVVVFNTFPLFQSPDNALRNCRRVLRKGGVLLVGQDRTRERLAKSRRIMGASGRGYTLPSDEDLRAYCDAYDFRHVYMRDSEYFSLVLVAESVATRSRVQTISSAAEAL
jgi:ubiquinone/menaquinone biosynthesis C-methylase UbiE